MNNRVCEQLGVEYPILAFSHCRDVVAAVTNAGGFGVLGGKQLADSLAIEPAALGTFVLGRQEQVDAERAPLRLGFDPHQVDLEPLG